jgi:hypothetical protein
MISFLNKQKKNNHTRHYPGANLFTLGLFVLAFCFFCLLCKQQSLVYFVYNNHLFTLACVAVQKPMISTPLYYLDWIGLDWIGLDWIGLDSD